jgi:hypothetical protein
MTVDPHTIDGESPEGAALVDAATRLITTLGELDGQQRAAFQAACVAARVQTLTSHGPPVADVWGALHDLVRAVRTAAGDTTSSSAAQLRLPDVLDHMTRTREERT